LQGTLKTARFIIDNAVPSEEVKLSDSAAHTVAILVEKVPRSVIAVGGRNNKKDFVNYLHLQGIIHAVCFVEDGTSTLHAKKVFMSCRADLVNINGITANFGTD
jgi:hypothetical protein